MHRTNRGGRASRFKTDVKRVQVRKKKYEYNMKQSVHDTCGHGKMWPRVPLVPTQREGRLGCSEEWMFIREVSSRSASNKSYEIHANTFFG